RCCHLFVHPKPSQHDLDAFYFNGEYYDKAEAELDRLLREASQRLSKLKRLCIRFGLSRRILDVGCASGHFMKQALATGWHTTGVERSVDTAKRARQWSGAQVISGRLEEIDLPEGPFPIVTAWEVVEHTIDPRAFFSALARCVAKGGLLALSTPLANGVPAKLLGTRFPMLTPPEHLSLFTRNSINVLASEFGFKEISYRSFSNLGPKSLASGLARFLFGKSIDELSGIPRSICRAAGLSLGWAPRVVDSAGWGTEMEIIFRAQS